MKFFRDGMTWVAAFGAILGVAVAVSPTAHADPIDRAICSVLDDYPSAAGVTGVGLGLVDHGYTPYDAGQKIAIAVYGTCPEHIPAVQEFLNSNDTRGMAV